MGDSPLSFVQHRGCRLAYRTRGDGPPVLFIQGVGAHGDAWLPQVDGLAGRFRCVTFDNRGMGASQPLGCPLTVGQMADDAAVVMGAAGVESSHVVGHSLGGLVALCLALSARPRVRSLALLNTFARGKSAAPMTLSTLWLMIRTCLGTRRMRRRAFLNVVMPPGAVPAAEQDAFAERLAPLFGHDLADQPPVTMKQLQAMRAYDATPRLGELAGLPTLVLAAAHDRIAPPAAGRAIAAGIPGARYEEAADGAHGEPIQHAHRVNGLLAEHFAGVEAVTPPRR